MSDVDFDLDEDDDSEHSDLDGDLDAIDMHVLEQAGTDDRDQESYQNESDFDGTDSNDPKPARASLRVMGVVNVMGMADMLDPGALLEFVVSPILYGGRKKVVVISDSLQKDLALSEGGQLDEASAIVEGYNKYFSFSRKRSGYSGVATVCKDSATPVKAEEGLTGLLLPEDAESAIGNYGNLTDFPDDELLSLDSEGRAILTQHSFTSDDGTVKQLIVINVYCPRADPEREDRGIYKLRFLALLQTRAEALVKAGYHVIVLGDVNVSHKAIDKCDPCENEEFKTAPGRRWINQFLWKPDQDEEISKQQENAEETYLWKTPHTTGGLFVDTFRYKHPNEKEAFTCWCQLTGARQTNYGNRIDYIMADIELTKSCLTDTIIMPDVEGSDHCPVRSDLNLDILPHCTCPLLCSKNMPEFSGKQQKLFNYFVKHQKSGDKNNQSDSNEGNITKHNLVDDSVNRKNIKTTDLDNSNLKKRPISNDTVQGAKKQKLSMQKSKSNSKQGNLMGFFSKTSNTKASVAPTFSKYLSSQELQSSLNSENSSQEAEEQLSVNNQPQIENTASSSERSNRMSTQVNTWKNILKGLGPVPLCKGHKEPCVLRMVKKDGPNKFKQFYVCAKPEGHSSNPDARCDHFQWIDKKKIKPTLP